MVACGHRGSPRGPFQSYVNMLQTFPGWFVQILSVLLRFCITDGMSSSRVHCPCGVSVLVAIVALGRNEPFSSSFSSKEAVHHHPVFCLHYLQSCLISLLLVALAYQKKNVPKVYIVLRAQTISGTVGYINHCLC